MGVRYDAPASVIRGAYRALAMELHPDRNSNKNANSQFQALLEAYAVLSDEKARQQYDANSAIPPDHAGKENQTHFRRPVVRRKGPRRL